MLQVDTLCVCVCVESVYPTRSDMTFTTNCLRASGIIRKQLVQLDSVMHPPQPSVTDERQRRGSPVTVTPRSS